MQRDIHSTYIIEIWSNDLMKFLSEIMHGYSGLDVRGEMFSKNIYILGDIAPVSSCNQLN